MKFFNLDCHISVIADIKKIFEDLGHQVASWCISGHNWVFGHEAPQVDVVNQNTWRGLNPEMCLDFYMRYKDNLSQYDGFICTHTPAFTLLFEKFGKPVISVSSTRYEQPFSNDATRWKWLNDYYNSNRNIIPVANNLYDKFYTEVFTTRKLEYIPSVCAYTHMQYSGIHQKALIHYKGRLNWGDNFDNITDLGRYRWTDIEKYKFIFILPYNASVISYFEYYTANIPLVLPGKKLLLDLYGNPGILSELSFNQVYKLPAKSAIPCASDFDPNNYRDFNVIRRAIELSDFYGEFMPHIIYIENLNELQSLDLDFKGISNKMREFNRSKKGMVYEKWKGVIAKCGVNSTGCSE